MFTSCCFYPQADLQTPICRYRVENFLALAGRELQAEQVRLRPSS